MASTWTSSGILVGSLFMISSPSLLYNVDSIPACLIYVLVPSLMRSWPDKLVQSLYHPNRAIKEILDQMKFYSTKWSGHQIHLQVAHFVKSDRVIFQLDLSDLELVHKPLLKALTELCKSSPANFTHQFHLGFNILEKHAYFVNNDWARLQLDGLDLEFVHKPLPWALTEPCKETTGRRLIEFEHARFELVWKLPFWSSPWAKSYVI